MDDKLLINELVSGGHLTSQEGEKAYRDAVSFGKPVEEILYARNLAGEKAIVDAKSKLLNIPVMAVNLTQISDELLKLVPEEAAKTYQLAPLTKEGDTLIVGMVHPENEKAQDLLRFIGKQNKLSLGAYLIAPSDHAMIMRKYSPFQNTFQDALRQVTSTRSTGKTPTANRIIGLEDKASANDEAPIIKIVASLLKEAINLGASDIHIEPQRTQLRIRFRIDGVLQEIVSMPIELHQPVLSRVKIMSDLKIDETRIPQDGRFRTKIFDREIDFRVSTFPTPAGEKAALRVLDPQTGLKNVQALGLVGHNNQLVEEAIARPYGMILITGPTGSGKSTTLYAMMQLINKVGVNVVSLEDPVEYTIDGINQSQVRPEIGYDFANGLRQILRQDPDVIMVGEIRDKETAELTVHAALTGHIVLSTLHTNNSVAVIPRLLDLKVEPFLLPSALNLMIAQRLVSKVCQKCKKASDLPANVASMIEKDIATMPADARSAIKKPYQSWRGAGCDVCKGRGTVGRIAIFEMFKMTPQLAEIIGSGSADAKIAEEAKRQGMITLRQDGIIKALQGTVVLEEVLRETEAGYDD